MRGSRISISGTGSRQRLARHAGRAGLPAALVVAALAIAAALAPTVGVSAAAALTAAPTPALTAGAVSGVSTPGQPTTAEPERGVPTDRLQPISGSHLNLGALASGAAGRLGVGSSATTSVPSQINGGSDTWSVVGSPDTSEQDELNAVTCVGADDCWAVGEDNVDGVIGTLIEQNTGSGWGVVSSPNPDPTANYLNAVACASATECWAVGDAYSDGAIIEQYNGSVWSLVTGPEPGSANWLTGVTCVNSSDCWASGYDYNLFSGVYEGFIDQYSSGSWGSSASQTTPANELFSGIACSGASECWAVGEGGNIEYSPTILIWSYSGSSWQAVSGLTTAAELYGVTCASASECWAVGQTSADQTLIEKYNGSDWVQFSSPSLGVYSGLNRVSCITATDCWAVGVYYVDLATDQIRGFFEEYSGSSWNTVNSGVTGATDYDYLYAMTCDGTVNCWAVGLQAPSASSTTWENLIEQYTEPIAPAMVTALTPAAGPVGGGQTVTVSGYAFASGMTVTLGGASVTISNVTPTSFSFTTPVHAAGGVTLVATDIEGSSLSDGNAGYLYVGLASYVPVTPFRVLDTRSATCVQCGTGALLPGGTMTLQVTGYTVGSESVPSGATSVALNVTAVSGSAESYLTIYPTGTGQPLSSNLNFNAQTNTANLVVVALGTGGAVNLYDNQGTVNLVADVEGYFAAPSGTAGEFHTMAPLRVCDSRAGQPANPCNNEGSGPSLPLGPGQVEKVDVATVTGSGGSIPSDGTAAAVVLNLTAVSGNQATYLSVYPTNSSGQCSASGQVPPQSSTLNVDAEVNQPNRVIVPLGPAATGQPDTDVCVYNSLGTINFILDADGWFGTSSAAAGTQFQVIGPSRICDTRAGTGTECSGDTLTAGDVLPVQVTGVGGVPSSGPVAVIANVIAVSGSSETYLTVYPADSSTTPNASDLNANAGENIPNLVIVKLSAASPAGKVDVYNSLGTINIVMDIAGWFQ
jgi:hypothetical protein